MVLNSWLFMRVTGVFLVLAFVVHHLENFFLGTSFMPSFLAYAVNLGLVAFTVTHALVGLKRVIDDQGIPRRAQVMVTWTLVPVGLFATYFAASAMVRFGLM